MQTKKTYRVTQGINRIPTGLHCDTPRNENLKKLG